MTGDESSAGSLDMNTLSMIARCLDDGNRKIGRKEFSIFGTDAERRQARVLDSLAYLLVSREAKHIVAVGLRLRQDESGLEVLLAEDGEPLQVTLDHLKGIICRLREIYADRPFRNSPNRITFYASETESSFERRIVELEFAVIRHSWAKLLHRFRKGSRYLHFIDTAKDVCGLPAAERADITNEEERGHLHTLQTFEKPSRDDVVAQLKAIETLGRISELDRPSDADIEDVRLILYETSTWKEKVQRHNSYRRKWDAYTSCRLRNGRDITGNDELARQESSDVVHWLSKLTEIREHYCRVVHVVTSPKLLPLLLHIVDFKRVTAGTAPSDRTLSLGYEELRNILDTSNINEVRNLLQDLKRVYNGSWTDASETKLVVDSGAVHCECLLLSQLHNRSAVPYIGGSKLSCARCDMYFSIYRQKTGVNVYARGTHGQLSDWIFPLLGDTKIDAAIERVVRSKIRTMIWHAWDEYSQPSLDAA